MATKRKHHKVLKPDNLDEFLAISGYTYQRTDKELEQFELLYENYDFKLKDFRVNPEEIISQSFEKRGKIFKIIDEDERKDINELRIAARKGNEQISKSILDKMKRKHKDENKQ